MPTETVVTLVSEPSGFPPELLRNVFFSITVVKPLICCTSSFNHMIVRLHLLLLLLQVHLLTAVDVDDEEKVLVEVIVDSSPCSATCGLGVKSQTLCVMRDNDTVTEEGVTHHKPLLSPHYNTAHLQEPQPPPHPMGGSNSFTLKMSNLAPPSKFCIVKIEINRIKRNKVTAI